MNFNTEEITWIRVFNPKRKCCENDTAKKKKKSGQRDEPYQQVTAKRKTNNLLSIQIHASFILSIHQARMQLILY